MESLNGTGEDPRKTIVYLGPSLPLAEARKILPHATYLPPARQGDIVTHVVNLNPTRIILIDGEIRQNLSVWHKEIVFALQYPGLKAIYGSASMGALRAAELDFLGMVGIGKIYEWYRDNVTEDDAEVVLNYTTRESPEGTLYYPLTVPLVDIRAGVEHYCREFGGKRSHAQRQKPENAEIAEQAVEFLESMRSMFYMERTLSHCEKTWAEMCPDIPMPRIEQKRLDAIQALTDYGQFKPNPVQKPTPDDLSGFFQALYDRDRRILIGGQEIPQQHIDSYVLLHNPEYERICWDAANQELALMLCDQMNVLLTVEEIQHESERFQKSSGVQTPEDFVAFLENNGWTRPEYDRLMIQNARIRKLQHSLSVSKGYQRNTRAFLDYLRTHAGFDYWAIQAAALEKKIAASGVDDWLGINLEKTAFDMLAEQLEREGLEQKGNNEEYLLETGFSNLTELSVALSRIAAGKGEE